MDNLTFVGTIVFMLFVYLSVYGMLVGILYHLTAISLTPLMTGMPYLETDIKELEPIFSFIQIKSTDIFADLGCGSGELIRQVTKKRGLKSVGCEINPLLVFQAKISHFLFKIKNSQVIRSKIENFSQIGESDVTFIFLYPPVIAKLENHLTSHLKKDSYLISRAFPLSGIWEKKMLKKFPGKQFPYYLYRV